VGWIYLITSIVLREIDWGDGMVGITVCNTGTGTGIGDGRSKDADTDTVIS
jgi:hypothetical protein